MEIGFLGLGIMGKAMALNLLRNGFKVTVWNRTLSKAMRFRYSWTMGFTETISFFVHGPWDFVTHDDGIHCNNLSLSLSLFSCFPFLRVIVIGSPFVSPRYLLSPFLLDSYPREELVEQGASIGETPAAVVKKCKYTIAMLSDPSAALSVVFDNDGVLEQICLGKGYIDMSTVDAETSSKISEAITKKGGYFLEAPVSGSKKPAEDGQLVILGAGEKALYEEIIPIFDVLGKKSFFLGQVGNAAKMKLVVNMIMGSMMNAFSEGLVLADKSGLSQQTLLDVVELGGIANPMFKLKGPAMIQNSFPPAFPLKHQQKDMRLALALGDENAVSMPIAAAANEAFKKARSLGLGDHDFSAVYKVVTIPEGAGEV